MKFQRIADRTFLAALFGAILVAGAGVTLHGVKGESGLARTSYDWLTVARGEVRANEAIVILMDEDSHERLEQPKNAPWDRKLHAQLLDRLTAAGSKVVAFDILFSDPLTNNPGADQLFAQSIKANGKVILTADTRAIGVKALKVTPPIALLEEAAVSYGFDDVTPGPDLVVRQHTTRNKIFDQIPTLSWAAAEFVKAPVTQQEGQEFADRWVNYYGRSGVVRTFSYYEALDRRRVPDEEIRGKAVFVGARLRTRFAGDRKDEYSSPFTYWLESGRQENAEAQFFSGVELQATMFLNLLRGDSISRWPPLTERLIIAAFGLLCGYSLVRRRPWTAAILTIAGIVAVTLAAYAAFSRLVWFPWLIPVVQGSVAFAWSVLFNSVQFYVQKRMMEHTLSLYLSPKLVRKLARNPKLLKPGAEKQTLTFFFTDIENFTTLAQGMDSDELAKFMNDYIHNIVANCIHFADGTVAKYIGDGIFSFWNAPEAQPDHAMRACDAALRLRELPEMNMHGKAVRTRVGIHTGEANVGNFGSKERVDYTAIGENVNLASRLEGLNKFLGTQSLISAETKAVVGDVLVTRRVGLFTLKGFDKSVEAFELVGRADAAESTKAWRAAFDQALRNYEEGDFELATMGFRGVLEMKPEDGPTKFYLERIEDASKEPLEGDWTGVTTLKEK